MQTALPRRSPTAGAIVSVATIVVLSDTGLVRPRSVIPGRQRWDVAAVKGRKDIAELLVAALLSGAGITSVQANTLTGRILVFHDRSLSGDDVADLIRRAARSSVRQAAGPATATLMTETPPGSPAQRRNDDRVGVSVPLAGMAVGVLGAVVSSPIVSLLGILGSTAVIVRRSWGRSPIRQNGAPAGLDQRTIRKAVGTRTRQLYKASFLSVLAQMFYFAPAFVLVYSWKVLIRGPIVGLTNIGIATASAQHLFLVSIVGTLLIAFAVTSRRAGVTWRELSLDVQHDWRTRVYSHVQRAELQYLDGERATRLAEVMSSDVDQLGGFLAGPASDLIQLAASFVFLLPIFLLTSSSLLWLVLFPLPYIAWMSFSYTDETTVEYGRRGGHGDRLNSQLVNNMEASATIKSLLAEDYETEHIRQLSTAFRQSTLHADTRSSAYLSTMQLSATVSFFGVMVFGGLVVIGGSLSFEVFQALVGLSFILHGKIPGLGDAIEQYQKTVVSLQRVQDLFDIPIETDEGSVELALSEVRGEMMLDNVTFGYPGRPPVLNDLSLRIRPGETTGIVGVTGAGKTTIAKLLLRFHQVDSGRVLLDGVDIRDVKLRHLRTAIGFVGQDSFLFDGTVGENIRYGTFTAADEQVVAAARLAAADGFIEALPAGYDTMVGEKGMMLSSGQRQRISLARGIVKGPPILVLDEATSAVDNETEASIQEAIIDFARERTLVVIAHRLSTVRNADWIYVLGEAGTIVEEGTHDELVERGGQYALLWSRQIGVPLRHR